MSYARLSTECRSSAAEGGATSLDPGLASTTYDDPFVRFSENRAAADLAFGSQNSAEPHHRAVTIRFYQDYPFALP